MRTKTLLLTAAVIAAGLATSMAQSNVYSVNVVGYVNQALVGNGQYTLVANPLDSGSNTLNNLIQPILPVNGKVLKWNGSSFNIYTRVAFGTGWQPTAAGSNTCNPGEGMFIQAPSGSAPLTNTWLGNVNQGTLTVPMVAGFTLAGNLAADAGSVTTLQLTNVPTNAKLLKWNTVNQSYDIFTKVAFGSGWQPSVPVLNVGDGFFMNSPSAFNWVRQFTVQ